MEYILIFIFSAVFTRIMIYFALKKGMLDIPNERSSHKIPTPRGGGLAIVVTFLIALWKSSTSIGFAFLIYFTVGALMVAAVGWLDDKYSLSANLRLLVHLFAAAVFLWGVSAEFTVEWNLVLVIIAVLWIGWMVNLYNFMDGIDGIASLQALSVILSYILLARWAALPIEKLDVLFALAATVTGFLIFNFPPAKIFMGDVASGFLGFVFGALAVWMHFTKWIPIQVSLILMATFIADTLYTLFVRMKSGQKFYQAHRSHGYQRAVQEGLSHLQVDAVVVGINLLWLLPIAWLVISKPELSWFWVAMAYLPLFWLCYYLKAGKSSAA